MLSTELLVERRHAPSASRPLDFDGVPMRLFQKSKRLGVWDPCDIDLRRDRADWPALDTRRRTAVLAQAVHFLVGEEAVTLDLLPLMMRVARAGLAEEEIYLTSFLWEEAKHTEFFRRWLDQVPGVDQDPTPRIGPSYRSLLLEELPRSMNRLLGDDSGGALARALVTYNMVVEGIVAQTGYWRYERLLERGRHLPGLAEGLRLMARDEVRHIRFGIHMLSRLVDEDHTTWTVIEDRMKELLPLAIAVNVEGMAAYEDRFGPGANLVPEDQVRDQAATQFQRRMRALRRACAPRMSLAAEAEND